MNPNILGFFSLISATLMYGFFVIPARIVGYQLPLFFQNWTRNLLAAVIILIPILIKREALKIHSWHDFGWISLRTIAGSIAFISYYIAIFALPVGTTYLIFYGSSTVGGYLLGRILFNEKMTPIKWLSLLLAGIGLSTMYSLNVSNIELIPLLCAVLAGFTTAIWNIVAHKVDKSYSVTQLTFFDCIMSFFIGFVISVFLKEQWSYPTFSLLWGANFLYSLFFVGTGPLVIYGFSKLGAQLGSIVMLTEIVFATAVGTIVYHEPLTLSLSVGLILIIAAIALPEITMKINTKKNKAL